MKAILLGLLLAGVVLSCSTGNQRVANELSLRIEKMNEVTQLWTQIRDWRGDMGMPLDPPQSSLFTVQEKTVKDSGKVCPENQKVPKPCEDKNTLANHICENAELICKIADELGKNDRAQEKCTSAKASCRDAKQISCNCISKPPVVAPPVTAPATPAPASTSTPATMAPTKTTTTTIVPVSKSTSTGPKKVTR